jgi:hypothetical protein
MQVCPTPILHNPLPSYVVTKFSFERTDSTGIVAKTDHGVVNFMVEIVKK